MRKNLRGFTNHVQAIAEKLMADEFPILAKKISCGEGAFIYKCWADFFPYGKDNGLARAVQYFREGDETIWHIHLNLDKRDFWLEIEDKNLIDLLRHEFLHAELKEQGKPHRDFDIEFIEEAIRKDALLEQRHYSFLYAHRLELQSRVFNFKFDKELFEFCFPDSFDYWAKQMKTCIFQTVAKTYLRSVSEGAILHILSDVKMAYSTLTDSVAYTKGQVGT